MGTQNNYLQIKKGKKGERKKQKNKMSMPDCKL